MACAQAEPAYQRSDRHAARHSEATVRAGRHAFGMSAAQGFADPNSPAATGGGSIGYNRKLLEY
jgi:hypothetical protein